MTKSADHLPNPKPGSLPTPAARPTSATNRSPAGRVPLSKPAVTPVRGAKAADEEESEEGAFVDTSAMLKQAPAWAVSMLVHIVVLLMLALIVSRPDEKPKPREIVSTESESEQPLEDLNENTPNPEQEEETTTEVATAEVVIPNVEVASDASDLEAAPLALETTDFGDQAAPAGDILSSIGAAGGTSTGFGGRKNPGKAAAGGGGGADTEAAVDAALKWLADHQMPDGSWSFDHGTSPNCNGKCGNPGHYLDRFAATGLALLPFLGRGYTHMEGPYKSQVKAGLKVLANQSITEHGKIYQLNNHGMYVQGLCSIALCEAFGMSQDDTLRQPAQYALDYIMDAQDPVGGGWRYYPKQPGDTSAVGWQIMALKSGLMGYLQVKPLTIKKASEFLDSMQKDSGSHYGYTEPGHSLGTTSIGLLCRMYMGWKKDHPALQRGVMALATAGPSEDLYYDYYATQVMHHMEGDVWIAWNNKMKALLLSTQSKKGHEAGSWYEGVSVGHGSGAGGRIYCTAMAALILEVYYRNAPLYRTQAVESQFRE